MSDRLKLILIALLFVAGSSIEGAAHSTKTPEKPSVEKPVEPVTPQTIERPTSSNEVNADVCAREPNRPECKTQPSRQVSRQSVAIRPVYPAPFLPMSILTYVTRDFGAVERKLVHGTPAVKSFSVGQPRSKCCTPAERPRVVAPKPEPKIQLPYGK